MCRKKKKKVDSSPPPHHGTLGLGSGYGADEVGMDTAVENTAISRGQTRQQCNAPNHEEVVFGTRFGWCPNVSWVVSSGLLLCFCLLYYLASFFVLGTEATMT